MDQKNYQNMAKLLISLPTGDVSHELTGAVITIGRTPDNKIQINHHSVSAHHATLQLTNGTYRLKDLDSTNRSCVNNIPVNEADLTGSCFLRFGSIECVFKSDNKGDEANNQLQSRLSELQRQMESLVKARDQISLQNQSLTKERDAAKLAAEMAHENLVEVEKKIGAGAGKGAISQQLNEASAKAGALQKQLDQISRERDALLISNTELKNQLDSANARLADLQNKPAAAPALPAPTIQQRAAEHVRQELDESVEDEEEEELAGVGRNTAAAGSNGRMISGPPLLGGMLNRKRNDTDALQAKPNNITSMPLPEARTSSPVAPSIAGPSIAGPSLQAPLLPPPPVPAITRASTPIPSLKIVQPPGGGMTLGTQPAAFRHKAAAAAAANAAPVNPDIKPAWELLNAMRRSLHYFLRHQDELKVLQEMEQNIHALSVMAETGLLTPIHPLTSAVEALIRDLHMSPKNINASTLRTVGQSIDFVATLLDEANLARIKEISQAKIFAVDDDQGILDTITATMEMASLNITTSGQPTPSLAMLSEQNFDLILLDVGLPEMNGMDMCSRIRAMANHQKTPIVFLTGEATAQNRVQSTLNGGNDLIGKPFSIVELTVKVLTWIFKGHLGLV